MQTIGYIIDKRTDEKIKLLIRIRKRIDKYCHVVKLKMRKSGSDGSHFIAEEIYLNDNYELMNKLKSGESNVYSII